MSLLFRKNKNKETNQKQKYKKVIGGIPEDERRNVAVIDDNVTDNVVDNVGDVAGQ